MDVRCPKCGTEYEVEERQVGPTGQAVRCSDCGHVFRVKRPAVGAPDGRLEAVVEGHDRPWMVRRRGGDVYTFRELTTLQTWIVERKVARDDEISRTGEVWKRLGNIAELAAFFQVVEQAERAERAAAEAAPAAVPAPAPAAPPPPSPAVIPPPPTPAAVAAWSPPEPAAPPAVAAPPSVPAPTAVVAPAAAPEAPAPEASRSRRAEDISPAGERADVFTPAAGRPPRRGRGLGWVLVLLLLVAAIGGTAWWVGADTLRSLLGLQVSAEPAGTAEAGDLALEPPLELEAHEPPPTMPPETGEPTAPPPAVLEAAGEDESVALGQAWVEAVTEAGAEGAARGETPPADAPAPTGEAEAGAEETAPGPAPVAAAPAPDEGTPAPAGAAEGTRPVAARRASPPPATYDGLMDRAYALRQRGRIQQALDTYGRAKDLKPDRAEPHAGLGWSYLELRAWAAAVGAFERALELHPGYGEALIGLAEAWRFQGDTEQAKRYYRRYLEVLPDGPEAAVARNALDRL